MSDDHHPKHRLCGCGGHPLAPPMRSLEPDPRDAEIAALRATVERIAQTKAGELTMLDLIRVCCAAGVTVRTRFTPEQRAELEADGLLKTTTMPAYCAYCGDQFEDMAVVARHIWTCREHPLGFVRRMAGEQWRRALDAERLVWFWRETDRNHSAGDAEIIAELEAEVSRLTAALAGERERCVAIAEAEDSSGRAEALTLMLARRSLDGCFSTSTAGWLWRQFAAERTRLAMRIAAAIRALPAEPGAKQDTTKEGA